MKTSSTITLLLLIIVVAAVGYFAVKNVYLNPRASLVKDIKAREVRKRRYVGYLIFTKRQPLQIREFGKGGYIVDRIITEPKSFQFCKP